MSTTTAEGRPATHVARVGRNAAILTAATFLCKIGSLAVMPFILRAFTTAEYGAYCAAFAYAGMLGMITYFGMGPIVVRDIARGDRPKGWVVFHCATLRMALYLVAAAVLLGIGLLEGFSRRMWILSWLAFAVMGFDALTGAVKASMQAEERFGLLAGVDAVRKASQWILAILVVLAGAGITFLAGGVVAAAGAAAVTALFLGLSRRDFHGIKFAPRYAAGMLKLAAPMGLSAAFVLALERVDIWVLDVYRGPGDVGEYAAAVVFKPAFLAQCVVWAMLPLAFRLAKENRPGLAKALRMGGRYLLVMGAGIAILFFCGGGALMPLLGGGKYSASVPVFQLMGLSLPFVFLGFLYLHALTAVDKQLVAACIFACGLAVNVAIDIALVPSMGPTGAMLATLTAEILMTVAAFAAVWRLVGRPVGGTDVRVVVAILGAAVAALVAYWAGIADMGLGALGVFAALLVLLRVVTKGDIRRFRQSLDR